jgi:molecular chaperone GrpE (heat shock protein)
LLEKDERIRALEAEYKALSERAAGDAAANTRENLRELFRRVAPPLAQLDEMRATAATGATARVEDVFKLVKALETALERAGLKAVGAVGEQTAFNARLHQRMSGGDVRDGDPVRVEFVGYELDGEVALRALVTRIP